MDPGTFVLLHLIAPKEKYWGQLKSLNPAGVTLRGIEVEVFDNWARQFKVAADLELGVATIFVPMHRIEKMFEDSRVGSVGSYAERFYEIVGRDVRECMSPEKTPSLLN